jgi:Protein of unknown function (DUF3433)
MSNFKFRYPSKRQNQQKSTEWKTWRLKRWFTIGLLLVEIGIVIAVLILERFSAKNKGIATVPQLQTDPVINLSISDMFWSYGLLWTALPAFLMALYRIGWDAIVSGTAERQPYIDLNIPEKDASTAQRTIMLDYRSYPILYNWIVAFRMKHILIGCAMLLSSVLSIALVPITSHLLAAAPTVVVSDFSTTVPNTFDPAPLMSVDLQPALSLARSTLAFGAEPPPWTTSKYSFEPFDLKGIDGNQNYTVPVNAFYGQVDCEFLDVPEPQVSSGNFGTTDNITTLTYNITDRGCEVSPVQISLSDKPRSIVARTWGTASCGDLAHNSRIVVLTGNPTSSTTITNVTVISCIPSYWKTTGTLTGRIEEGSTPKLDAFKENASNETEFRPLGADLIETDLTLYVSSDPKAIFITDILGTVVYEVARKSNPANPLDSKAVKSAIESVWPSVFAYLTTTYLIQRPDERKVQGQASRSETRLFVVSPVAWTIVVIMILVVLCNTFLILHAESNRSILAEEPIGLLGAAVLLQDSDISGLVTRVQGRNRGDIKVREGIKKNYNLEESKCWYDKGTKRIRVTITERDQAASSGARPALTSGAHVSATSNVQTPSSTSKTPDVHSSKARVDISQKPDSEILPAPAAPGSLGKPHQTDKAEPPAIQAPVSI